MMGRAVILAVALAAGTWTVATSITTQAVELVTPTTSTRPTTPPTRPTLPPILVTPTTSATTNTTTTTSTTVATSLPMAAPTAPPGVATLPPVIAAATTTTIPDGDIVAIGEIDTDGAVPDGLDLSAFPGLPQDPGGPAAGDGPQLAAGFSCAYQCIKSGVAYPRGTGVELVVETHVPARLFMSVVDHDNDAVDFVNSVGMVTEFSWALDHLEPGATYFVLVAATDDNDDTAHAYGEFTTLSRRTVEISVGFPTVFGGPTNIVDSSTYLGVSSLDYVPVGPDDTSVHIGLHRYVDVAVLVFRRWETSQNTVCEGTFPDDLGSQGDSDDKCGCWNTAAVDGLDLDAIPDGPSRWTEVTSSITLQTPAGDDGLPPGYGDPRYFAFSVLVTVSVAYD